MPDYVVLYRYTQQGIKNIKDTPSRIKAAKSKLESAGLKLKDLYLTMGQYDLVAIIEAPSDETMISAILSHTSEGNITTETLKAFSEEEFIKIIEKLP